jgi:tRNA-Thr(GGU) m(6)t(6)A37 methyltransferase TsaA
MAKFGVSTEPCDADSWSAGTLGAATRHFPRAKRREWLQKTTGDSTMDSVTLHPIGIVQSSRREAIDDGWDEVASRIALDSNRFGPDALLGLDQFSHLEVVYYFHHPTAAREEIGARRPRGRPDWPEVGIFAQRGKNRPNRLGVTACRLLAVEGLVIHVEGLDAIEGSPVLDIKPYMSGFAPRGPLREPRWARELMADYWAKGGARPDENR